MIDNELKIKYWKPEYVNEKVEGIYFKVMKLGKYNNKVYLLENEDEKITYGVWHKMDLERMNRAKIGDYIIITYKGEIETNQHTMQKYDVEIIEDPEIE